MINEFLTDFGGDVVLGIALRLLVGLDLEFESLRGLRISSLVLRVVYAAASATS